MTGAERLYHGTRRGFSRGGIIVPRAQHGGAGTTAPLMPGRVAPECAPQWVYVTEDEALAWVYAWHAPGRGRPKVLVVEPRGALTPDPEHSAETGAWRCEWAAVTRVLTEPLVTEEAARSGWVLTP